MCIIDSLKYLFIFSIFVLPFIAESKHSTIQLEDKRELFVDHYLIDKLNDVRIVLHEPRDEGPVFYFDKPWEGAFCGYCTVIKDGELYRAYYRGLPTAGKDYSASEVTCYAESNDGIQWKKPKLGIFEIDGSLDNNVILADAAPVTHNFCPFIDANPKAETDQRFKALGGNKNSGLIPYVSPDGIHWKKLREQAVIVDGKFDSQNVAFWSGSESCYVCYFRTWSRGGFKGFRSVSRATSEDFINWTEPVEMTFGDTPMEHLYTQQTHPYFRAPQIYIAIGARFMPNRQVLTDEQAAQFKVDPKYYKDCSDAIFMTSRGGNVYDRTFMESFIRPGIGLENWVSRSNYPALNVAQTGPTEMSIYVNQNYAQSSAHLRRYSLRLDGFTSIKAPYNGGEMVTQPFTFTGNKLVLNYATSAAGEIRVEIQDENGNSIPGFSAADSQALIGNEIERVVSWTNGDDVSGLAGQIIRLRFVMKDADLYSLKFD